MQLGAHITLPHSAKFIQIHLNEGVLKDAVLLHCNENLVLGCH